MYIFRLSFIEENPRNLLHILQNIQKKTISFRKLPIYNKKPMSLRKGIGFCQQSESSLELFFNTNLELDSFYFPSKPVYNLASKYKVNYRNLLND